MTEIPTEGEQVADHLAEIKRVLRTATAKVEFGMAFSLKGSMQTAQVWEQVPHETRYTKANTTRWVKVGPFLTTAEGTRKSLFELLAHLADEDT